MVADHLDHSLQWSRPFPQRPEAFLDPDLEIVRALGESHDRVDVRAIVVNDHAPAREQRRATAAEGADDDSDDTGVAQSPPPDRVIAADPPESPARGSADDFVHRRSALGARPVGTGASFLGSGAPRSCGRRCRQRQRGIPVRSRRSGARLRQPRHRPFGLCLPNAWGLGAKLPTKDLIQLPRHTKTGVVDPRVGVVPVARGGPQGVAVVPGTAANHTAAAAPSQQPAVHSHTLSTMSNRPAALALYEPTEQVPRCRLANRCTGGCLPVPDSREWPYPNPFTVPQLHVLRMSGKSK